MTAQKYAIWKIARYALFCYLMRVQGTGTELYRERTSWDRGQHL